MAEKTYTEAEIRALLARAAQLQADGGAGDSDGLTLDEVKKAAADAGIDPRFVDLASVSAAKHRPTYAGIPTGVGRSVVAQGTLTDESWNRMVELFTRKLGGPGDQRVSESRRSWARGPTRVTAEQVGDKSSLNIETAWGEELQLPVALSIVGAIAAATTGAAAFVAFEWTIGVVALFMALAVAAVFSGYRRSASRRQDAEGARFEGVLDQCVSTLREQLPEAAQAPAINGGSPSGSFLELPEEHSDRADVNDGAGRLGDEQRNLGGRT